MIIYKTINLINGKYYIGQDKNNNPRYLGSGKLLKRAMKKYGKENFKKEILEYCYDKEDLDLSEKFHILNEQSHYQYGNYNITYGGTGGDTITNNPNKEIILEKHKKAMNDPNLQEQIRNTKDNKSEEEKELLKKNQILFHQNRTETEKKIISQKISKAFQNRSREDEKLRGERIRSAYNNKTQEEKDLINQKRLNTKYRNISQSSI